LNSIFLVVDYDKDNVDIKIMSTSKIPEGIVKQYGIDMTTNMKHKSFSRYYPEGKSICNRTYKCYDSAQLDDLPYNTPFADMIVNIFKLVQICSVGLM
jgi:hypothetical protein